MWLPKRLAFAPFEVLNKGDASSYDSNNASSSSARLRTVLAPQHSRIDPAAVTARYPHLRTTHSDHAAHASTCNVGGSCESPSAFFLARAIEDASILELRWLRVTGLDTYLRELEDPEQIEGSRPRAEEQYAQLRIAKALEELASPPLPELFQFPAPLLPDTHVFVDALTSTLQVLAVTATGYLYRLTFALPDLFHAAELRHGWCSEHKIASVGSWDSAGNFAGGRTPQNVHFVDAGLIIVSCSDGTLIKLEQHRAQDGSDRFAGERPCGCYLCRI